jgi:hypothetical protein
MGNVGLAAGAGLTDFVNEMQNFQSASSASRRDGQQPLVVDLPARSPHVRPE